MVSVAAVIRKVVAKIYPESVSTDGLNRDDTKIALESGRGIGRDSILNDLSGQLIGRSGVDASLKSINETGSFPYILEKAGAPQEVVDMWQRTSQEFLTRSPLSRS